MTFYKTLTHYRKTCQMSPRFIFGSFLNPVRDNLMVQAALANPGPFLKISLQYSHSDLVRRCQLPVFLIGLDGVVPGL
jgi:hypothetical protein